MSGYAIRHIEEMRTLHDGLVKLAGAELGVESFGMQVLDLPPRFEAYPAHDHAGDGQEEVYVVIGGAVEFELDGERVAVDPPAMIRVAPETRRMLRPGPEGARVLAIGRPVAAAYERPEDFQLRAVPR